MSTPKRGLNVINPNDKVDQLRQAFAADPVKAMAESELPSAESPVEQGVIDALRTVYDPEIPLNIYDLGLVYHVKADGGAVTITMTLTAPGCPVAGDIVADVERKVSAAPGVTSTKVDLVFEPAWSKERMSEAALLELGLL